MLRFRWATYSVMGGRHAPFYARYALTSRLGEQWDRVINTSDPFGWVVFPLRQSSDTLTLGLWTVTLGQVLKDDQEPVDVGILPLSV